MPRPIQTHTASAMHIFHLKLGGGIRHRLAICAYAIVAAKNGWRGLPTDRFGNEGEIPDLIIEREDRIHEGARRRNVKFRYRVEIIDTHDPVPDYKPGDGGYQDCIKVFLKKGEEFCLRGHDLTPPQNHSLCLDGLLWLCERNLP